MDTYRICNICGEAYMEAGSHATKHAAELFDKCQHCGHQRSFHGFYGCESMNFDPDSKTARFCTCKRRQAQVVPASRDDIDASIGLAPRDY